MSIDRDVEPALGKHPESQSPGLRNAAENDPATGRHHEFPIGVRERHPVAPHPNESSVGEGSPETMSGVASSLEACHLRHTAASAQGQFEVVHSFIVTPESNRLRPRIQVVETCPARLAVEE
ncbi:hypothetical protein [Agromyces neolithicus]|uniref:Uncharacterized protein n=1 Tax=Agromyces neolithicus TaxID=269420 RepID=A0ABN2MA51_9MICO